jgi:hypothetical protein
MNNLLTFIAQVRNKVIVTTIALTKRVHGDRLDLSVGQFHQSLFVVAIKVRTVDFAAFNPYYNSVNNI